MCPESRTRRKQRQKLKGGKAEARRKNKKKTYQLSQKKSKGDDSKRCKTGGFAKTDREKRKAGKKAREGASNIGRGPGM